MKNIYNLDESKDNYKYIMNEINISPKIEKDKILDKFNKKLFPDLNGNIQFINVSFKLKNKNKWIFNNLNFKIEQGSKIEIFGLPKTGKSLIFELILRFYNIDKGKILIDEFDI